MNPSFIFRYLILLQVLMPESLPKYFTELLTEKVPSTGCIRSYLNYAISHWFIRSYKEGVYQ
jgi:hypothetical protein